jgi:hypothetical protein
MAVIKYYCRWRMLAGNTSAPEETRRETSTTGGLGSGHNSPYI